MKLPSAKDPPIAFWTRRPNNRDIDAPVGRTGVGMRKQILLLLPTIVMASWLPFPAAAEMPGVATCANPSWHVLVSGECGIDELHIGRQPDQVDEDSSTALVFTAGPVPEPETYALMLVGLVAVVVASRRRRRRRRK